jgi:HAD superfamily hydrolase (TIGR01484 family)
MDAAYNVSMPSGTAAGAPFDLTDVGGLFTDVDGTLTTAGRILPSTYAALCQVADAGVPVVLVTGRPSGWGDALLRLWPVAAVVSENGGVIAYHDRRGRLQRELALPAAELAATRRRMHAAARAVARAVPGARLSGDSIFTEVDLAVDWNEDVHLPEAAAEHIERLLRARGFCAVRSSVHVNFWPPGFDKLSACRRVVQRVLGGRTRDLGPYIYVGDALNDEPMFRGFPRSVGVANVRAVWAALRHKPAHVTRAAYGKGFEEVVRGLLRAKRAKS